MAKLRWYAARLAAMSPPEIAHRLREAVLKRQAKGDRRGWTAFDGAACGPMADLALVRQRLAAAAPLAGEARVGQTLTGLGVSVDATLGAAAFLVDPVSRSLWPGAERYCFDIDVRSTGAGRGDVKFVWEINRMQFLHPVAPEHAVVIAAELSQEVHRAEHLGEPQQPVVIGLTLARCLRLGQNCTRDLRLGWTGNGGN